MKNRKLESLVEKAMKNNQNAFAELCTYKGKSILYNCIRLMGNQHDGEDAAQEVFLRMQSGIHTLKSPQAFNSWLQNLTFNICCDMRRKSMKMKDALTTEDMLLESIGDESLDALPQSYIEQDESRQKILSIIENLPENYRVAVQLYYYEALSYQEIAQVLDTTPAAVSSYLQRAKKVLRIKLDEDLKKTTPQSVKLMAIGPALNWVLREGVEKTVPDAVVDKCLAAVGVGHAVGITALGFAKAAAVTLALVAGVGTVGYTAKQVIPSLSALSPAGSTSDVGLPQGPGYDSSLAGDGVENIWVIENMNAVTGRIMVDKPDETDPNARAGVEGVTLYLASADAPDEVLQTTETLGGVNNGIYVFADLQPGTYIVRLELPEGAQVAENAQALYNGGHLLLDGQEVFEFSQEENVVISGLDLTLVFPATLEGSVQLAGRNGMAIEGGEKYLPHVVAVMADPQQRELATAPVQADGSYCFTNPPVSQVGTHTIYFRMEDSKGIQIPIDSMQLQLQPGKSFVLEEFDIVDSSPPIIHLELHSGDCACNHLNPGRIAVTVSDAVDVAVSWSFTNSDSGEVALRGTGTESLATAAKSLPEGGYMLRITAEDLAGNKDDKEQFIEIGQR